jgi:hypothetical protein
MHQGAEVYGQQPHTPSQSEDASDADHSGYSSLAPLAPVHSDSEAAAECGSSNMEPQETNCACPWRPGGAYTSASHSQVRWPPGAKGCA